MVRESCLSQREEEVLRLLATDATLRMIALKLGISPGTVRLHVYHIYQKLGVGFRVMAVLEGIRQGLVVVEGIEATNGRSR